MYQLSLHMSPAKTAVARVVEMLAADVPDSIPRLISVNPEAVKTAMFHKSGLEDVADMPTTDVQLSAEIIVWPTSKAADFLSGRLA